MEWSNEKVFTFLEILQTEPCLWDPRLKSFKNRRLQNDAWRRIMEVIPFKTTVELMKKKKESLMGYYRIHLHKFRKSLESLDSEVYKTNWFAYEKMDSFLREVYDSNPTVNTVINENNEVQDGSEGKSDGNDNGPHLSSEIEQVSQNIHEENRDRPGDNKSSRDSSRKRQLREELPPEMREAQCQMDLAFEYTNEKEDGECEIFGRLIATKLQKIRNPNTRDILMNDIHNLVFRTCMADRRVQRSSVPQISTSQFHHRQTYSRSPNPSFPNSTAFQSPHYEINSPSPRDQFSLCSIQSSQENFSETARASSIVMITDSDTIKIEE